MYRHAINNLPLLVCMNLNVSDLRRALLLAKGDKNLEVVQQRITQVL